LAGAFVAFLCFFKGFSRVLIAVESRDINPRRKGQKAELKLELKAKRALTVDQLMKYLE